MKAIIFVVLISLISISLAQPNLDGSWVSDTCEPIPGKTTDLNFYFIRNYTVSGTNLHFEMKIYQSNCNANNFQAKVVSEGTVTLGGLSTITPGCDLNGTQSAVYDIQFFYANKTITTVKGSNFFNKFNSLCFVNVVDGEPTDISTLNCQIFQFFSPCVDGEYDVITVIEAEGTAPARFHNGVRTTANICQLLRRPTQLASNACVLDGTGVSATPAVCTAYVAPVAPPVAAPVAVPVTPPTPKKSIGSFVFSSSILVLAAGVVAFF
eukprot:TRINITY_DN4619_c0_g1_i1.p1 TRINITY_DN4619_c0_g1~~TRINITY_DN4619_c0_g1_i1.p1  ORF type:complete len:266 (+),score=46.71 TRINITY_DN4619_c0_g1_i1:47-844(+)